MTYVIYLAILRLEGQNSRIRGRCPSARHAPNYNFSSPGVHLAIHDSNGKHVTALRLFASQPEDGSCDTAAEEGFFGAT